MAIVPLPQFEADLEADRKAYEALAAPTSLIVRFGKMGMIAEMPYDGSVKPGCGTKLVVRTYRGVELGDMLTTCSNGGCGNAITRKQVLQYVENSGGRDYPFFQEGRVLRVATLEDLTKQASLDASVKEMVKGAREVVDRVGVNMRVVDAEPILGGERITFHFVTDNDERVDFRPVVMELAAVYRTRIEMHQVGPRDEARLTADYERCGQHCCCKQFLKVLKPVAMKQAKIQKATLDPLKISGRCGRLMCCLRYEEQTYEQLRKSLPNRRAVVNTPDGPGVVIDTQTLTQLVLVQLDKTGDQVAFPVENITKTDAPPRHGPLSGNDDDDAPPARGGPRGGPSPGGRGPGGGPGAGPGTGAGPGSGSDPGPRGGPGGAGRGPGGPGRGPQGSRGPGGGPGARGSR